ncbi:ATP-dependent nuclease [Thalassospira tepidiphila]|uniref:ATP-dependent nuclease n=1 Tax=Thalassospira tepidiphila TaxID=393657 RepID=UPI003AA8E0D2
MKYVATKHNNFPFELDGVTVFLGANGSGKSSLLRDIKEQFSSVYVEGGRTIPIQDVVALNRQNYSQYQSYDKTRNQYKSKRKQKLVDRLFDALMFLIQKEQVIKNAHSDAVVEWDQNGNSGSIPKREQPPLEKLFEQYSEIFPHLRIVYDKNNGKISVRNEKHNAEYGPSSLSDGEKQVFSLLADMLQLEDEYDLVVVDEPELNLHPELAERLWNLLESEYQDKSFVYATHSIQFAMRSNVDSLYVISSDPNKIRRLSNLQELNRNDIEKFLGGVPGILNANTVLVTEGHEKSFDSVFYRWLVEDNSVEIFACGNSNDVKQVVGKSGLWSEISSDIKLLGIIDSDYGSSGSTDTADNILPLQLHEAESYLCIPELLVAAATQIGTKEKIPTAAEVETIIFQELDSNKIQIALKRLFPQSHHTARISLSRSVLSEIQSKEQAMEHIKTKSSEQIDIAIKAMSADSFEEALEKQLSLINDCLEERNVLEALRIIPGKELASQFCKLAGCSNSIDLIRSVSRNLRATDFPLLRNLQKSLSSRLSLGEISPEGKDSKE